MAPNSEARLDEEVAKKVLRQVVRDIEVERGIDPGPDPDKPEFFGLDHMERELLAAFLIDTGQATEYDLDRLGWFD